MYFVRFFNKVKDTHSFLKVELTNLYICMRRYYLLRYVVRNRMRNDEK